jgi:leader peptidase (prepilin peptidase) / N-methyltransferase
MINIAFTAILFPLGILAGIMINYISDTLPITRSLGMPICIKCHKPTPWGRYLIYSKCQECGSGRTARSFVVQALFPLAFVSLWFYPPARLGTFLAILLLTYFSVVFIIDLEHRAILLPVVYIGAVIMVAVGWKLHGIKITLLGGIAGYAIMLGFYLLGIFFERFVKRLRGEKLDEVALGFGDVNLSGVLGLVLGWPGITAGLFFGILSAGLVSLFIIVKGVVTRNYHPYTAIPYAPFLIFGAVLLLFR